MSSFGWLPEFPHNPLFRAEFPPTHYSSCLHLLFLQGFRFSVRHSFRGLQLASPQLQNVAIRGNSPTCTAIHRYQLAYLHPFLLTYLLAYVIVYARIRRDIGMHLLHRCHGRSIDHPPGLSGCAMLQQGLLSLQTCTPRPVRFALH